jgi:hypothetical protein
MKWPCLALLLLASILPALSFASTAPDLRSQITINGDVSDFAADDWVLDETTTFAENADDSRWGTDNDIRAIAVTWDNFNVYIGVPAVVVSTTLMLFVDVGCGGVDDLHEGSDFRRNIEFSVNTPNILMKVRHMSVPPELAALDCNHPVSVVSPAEYQGIYAQDGSSAGALEVAIPWVLLPGFEEQDGGVSVPEDGRNLRVLAVVTGGLGMGAGDAAPDPSVALENDSTRVAILNNYVELPLDSDGDGTLDIGVSPRAVATYGVAVAEDVREILPITLIVEDKLIAPGKGQTLDFRVALSPPDYQQAVYLTGRIYSSSGQLLRVLFEDEPSFLSVGPVAKSWDGRDAGGRIVPGGVYVLAVSGGPGKGSSQNTVTESVAVIR